MCVALLTVFLGVFVARAPGLHAATYRVPEDFVYLQVAIDRAASGDTILLAPGTHLGADFGRPVELYVEGRGGPDSVTVAGDTTHAALAIRDQAHLHLAGIRITGGTADHPGGGLIVEDGARLEARDCIVEENTSLVSGGGVGVTDRAVCRLERTTVRSNAAGRYGGGVAVLAGGTLELVDCMVESNRAQIDGGGVYVYRARADSIVNSTFLANEAGKNGAGLCVVWGGKATLVDCKFESNTGGLTDSASAGGAIYCGDSTSTVQSERCEFRFNRGVTGGAVAVYRGARFDSVGDRFEGNEANWADRTGYGGAIALFHESSATFDAPWISGNSAVLEGGGVHAHSADVVLVDGIICDNRAGDGPGAGWGGGVFLNKSFSNLSRTLICSNHAGRGGGGLFSQGRPSGVPGGSGSVVTECEIASNTSFEHGGVESGPGDSLVFIENVVRDNEASGVGGIGIVSGSGGRFEGNEIYANRCRSDGSPLFGGAIYIWDSWPEIIGNEIHDNVAAGSRGGGVRVVGALSHPSIHRNVFRRNEADVGSGVDLGDGAYADIEENLFEGHRVTGDWGVIACSGRATGRVVRNTVVHTVIDSTGAVPGGAAVALLGPSAVEFTDNIVSGTRGGAALHVDAAGDNRSYVNRNAFWDNEGGTHFSSAVGELEIRVDPAFVAGDSLFRLASDSPVLDIGSDTDSAAVSGSRSDLGWQERPLPAYGAFRVQFEAPTDTVDAGGVVQADIRVENRGAMADGVQVTLLLLGRRSNEQPLWEDAFLEPGESRTIQAVIRVPPMTVAQPFVVAVRAFRKSEMLGGDEHEVWVRVGEQD